MDLNNSSMYFSCNGGFTETDKSFSDTTLRLDCHGYGGNNNFKFVDNQNDLGVFTSMPSDDGCKLLLGLGPMPKAYCEAKQTRGSSSLLLSGISNDGDSILKLGLSGGSGEFLGSLENSGSTHCDQNADNFPRERLGHDRKLSIPVVDEGSTSAKKSGGYMPSLLFAPRRDNNEMLLQTGEDLHLGTRHSSHQSQTSSEPSDTTYYTVGSLSEPSAGMTSSEHRIRGTKRCRYNGCTKGARGASGLCIGHGGGQRCQKPGCNRGSESRTAYCKAHGGGKRCQHLGCTKSAEGKTDFCIAHGGGRRCRFPGGCSKAARGKSGLCIRHGGGKRCKVEGCTRSAEGQAGLCISHGGGRRCQFQGCNKGAQGCTLFCKAHGGGKRCIFAGCSKGAEGSTPLCKGHGGGKRCMFDGGGICPKSVHGGTNFCVAHGGGKRCTVPGCTKSARGRTDFCVRHGGGKRCKVENCGKSAQGSTDFCKAHGGGKRCNFGGGKCEKFARGKSGLCAAHSTMVQGKESKKGCMIAPGLFHGLVSASSSTSGVTVVSDNRETQLLIPPEVLVPLSMKSTLSYTGRPGSDNLGDLNNGDSIHGRSSFGLSVPEGRVHGGGLLSLLGGNLSNAVHGT